MLLGAPWPARRSSRRAPLDLHAYGDRARHRAWPRARDRTEPLTSLTLAGRRAQRVPDALARRVGAVVHLRRHQLRLRRRSDQDREEIGSRLPRLRRGRLQEQRRRVRVHARADAAVQRGAVPVPPDPQRPPRRPVRLPALARLETPWPNGTTGDLLTRMIQDADLAGNAYVRRNRCGRRAAAAGLGDDRPRRPATRRSATSTSRSSATPTSPAARLGRDPVILLPERSRTSRRSPTPAATFRGMSWLTPVIREIMADGAATTHKLKFFENGATPNLVVTLDGDQPEKFEKFKATSSSSGHAASATPTRRCSSAAAPTSRSSAPT
jgi:hypothetical protein